MGIFGGGSQKIPPIKATAPTLSDASIESSSRRSRDDLTGRLGVGGFSSVLSAVNTKFGRLGSRFFSSLGIPGK